MASEQEQEQEQEQGDKSEVSTVRGGAGEQRAAPSASTLLQQQQPETHEDKGSPAPPPTHNSNLNTNSNLPFTYTPLQAGQIRLLRFHSSPTTIELTNVSLATAPPYIALSYHWGSPALSHPITVNNSALHITANLHKLLSTIYFAVVRGPAPPLFEKDEDVYLWADGICINQQDVREKNEQVKLLDRIYKSAKGSLGYIGAQPRGMDAKEAFVRFAGVAGVQVHGLSDEEGRGRESTSTNATTVAKEKSDEKKSESFGQELWNSQWYLRSWVTQEVVLPDVMICLFGDEDSAITFPVDLLASLVHQVQVPDVANIPTKGRGMAAFKEHGGQATQVHSWAKLRRSIREKDSDGINLIKVLDLLHPADASDKRDKVYSILSLVPERDRQGIKIDYAETNTVEKTYTDLARHCISTGSDCMRMLEHAASTRQITNMPSWVPDWSFQPRFPLDSRLYHAAGSTKCTAHLSPCGSKIITQALLFDQIILPGPQVSYPDYKIINNTFNASTHPHSVTLVLDAIATRFCNLAHEQWGRNPGRNPDDPLDQIISRTLTADRGYGDRRATDANVSSYRVFKAASPRDFSGKYHSGEAAAPFREFLAMTVHCQRGRSVCLTQAGCLAACPGDVRRGDWLAILPGGNLPFVLRRKGEAEFEVVGCAYVHGAMDGEVLIRLGMVMGKDGEELFERVVELV